MIKKAMMLTKLHVVENKILLWLKRNKNSIGIIRINLSRGIISNRISES